MYKLVELLDLLGEKLPNHEINYYSYYKSILIKYSTTIFVITSGLNGKYIIGKYNQNDMNLCYITIELNSINEIINFINQYSNIYQNMYKKKGASSELE